MAAGRAVQRLIDGFDHRLLDLLGTHGQVGEEAAAKGFDLGVQFSPALLSCFQGAGSLSGVDEAGHLDTQKIGTDRAKNRSIARFRFKFHTLISAHLQINIGQ